MDTVQAYRNRETGQEVEAVKLTAENISMVADWCVGQEVKEIDALDASKTYVGLNFVSWSGVVRASEGDYIIKDHIGDFHSRWPRPFEANFERVNDEEDSTGRPDGG